MSIQGPYRQTILGVELSIEKDTETVPKDGKFHVVKEGQVAGSFRSLKQAQELFKRLVAESGYTLQKPPEQGKSAAEMSIDRFMDAKDRYWAESFRYRSRGGKGGRM